MPRRISVAVVIHNSAFIKHTSATTAMSTTRSLTSATTQDKHNGQVVGAEMSAETDAQQTSSGGDENVVDADFEEVDPDAEAKDKKDD